MILTDFLASNSYIITNKFLIQLVGLEAAILLGELCSEYNYWDKTNQLTNDDWFYSTRENIENNTGLSEYKQRIALNKLTKRKIIHQIMSKENIHLDFLISFIVTKIDFFKKLCYNITII